jgi:hypothetical protein
MSRILVTGMSGTGKSSALAELGRRGCRVVDTDDPGWREYREYVEFSDEVDRGEWLWGEERITGWWVRFSRSGATCGNGVWLGCLLG